MLDAVFSWVEWLFGAPTQKLPLPLIDMRDHRRGERIAACGGTDPLDVFVAYAQNSHVYTPDNRVAEVSPADYAKTPASDRVNKFGLAYRPGARLLLHERLADVVVDAAIDLFQRHRWRVRLYDGLRTMEAGQTMVDNADPKWLADGLLALPGKSAHNRALAADLAIVNAEGREIERFDNLDMTVNHRDYAGSALSQDQSIARLEAERAFQRAAIGRGLALAPLASEYWDYRVPGSDADLWRVIHSLARCTGQPIPRDKAQDYALFAKQWETLNTHGKLTEMFGDKAAKPPPYERILFHEKIAPVYDHDLPAHLRQTEMSRRTASATRADSLAVA